MILATDLDRTLLPNGDAEYDNSLPLLFQKIKKAGFTLIYVSGQNLDLLKESVKKYGIELPDYFIAEVGTVIYEKAGDQLIEYAEWGKYIKEQNPNWNKNVIVKKIGMENILELQEGWKQNNFKISYYLRDKSIKDEVLKKIYSSLKNLNIKADVIWSVDPLQNVGLIDILPKNITKLGALEFMRNELRKSVENLIYCGDSGNDILPLTFGYKAILVKNADKNVVEEVKKISREKGIKNNIYIASGKGELNGNYSSGIMEGLEYFNIV